MNFSRFALRLAGAGFVAAALTSASVRAELKWDRLESTLQVKSWVAQETVKFGFTNAGTTPVKILEVAPSCGCTVAALDRPEVAPGERGEITADFHPAGKVGTVRIPIRVRTDGDPAEVTLTLVATISEPLQLGARFVYWKSGEPRAMRTVRLTVADREQVELVGVECTTPNFKVTLAPLASDQAHPAYEVQVTPPAEGIAYGAVMVRTREGPARTERLHSIVVRTL